MDRLRIVAGVNTGSPTTLFDLNDGTVNALVRDTFKLTPPERRQQFSDPSRRYGGARLASETHGNGALSAEWLISGATADTALDNMENFLAELDSLSPDRWIEWRPDGATESIFYEIKGPGPWEPTYQWITFQSTRTLRLSATWAIAPLGQGLPIGPLTDDFSTNTLATNYTFDEGSGTLSVVGGVLDPSSTSAKRLYHSTKGKLYDCEVTLKHTTGATTPTAAYWAGVVIKRLDSNNNLLATVNNNLLSVYKRDGGVLSSLSSTSIAALAANTTYWIRIRIQGNSITAEHWTTAPTLTGSPAASFSSSLAGANATKFGVGVSGDVGIEVTPGDGADASYDDFSVTPNVFANLTLPATFSLQGVPGTAPALADITVVKTTALSAPFGLIGWTKKPTTPLAGSVAPFGIIEAETGADLVTWASTAEATARGGTMLRHTPTGATSSYTASYLIDPSSIPPDDFTGTEKFIEVWARVYVSSAHGSAIFTASVAPSDGNSYGTQRYTLEHGTSGRSVVLPSGGVTMRMTRLGTLVLDTETAKTWKLYIQASVAAGGAQFGLDYLILVPSQKRALSPTAKDGAGTNYPHFFSASTAQSKTIRSDLSGTIKNPVGGVSYPDHGLGGSLLELSPGDNDFVVKLATPVPDSPTINSSTEQLSYAGRTEVVLYPRYRLVK